MTKLPFKRLWGEARGEELVFFLRYDWRGLAPEIQIVEERLSLF